MLEIKHPSTEANLQVTNQEFSDKMTWEAAQRAASELGSEWRLPDKEELEAIYQQLYKKKQGDFKKGVYWSSFQHGDNFAGYFNFNAGFAANGLKTIPYYVCAVRTL